MEGIIKFKGEKLKKAFEILQETDNKLYSQIDKATDEIKKTSSVEKI